MGEVVKAMGDDADGRATEGEFVVTVARDGAVTPPVLDGAPVEGLLVFPLLEPGKPGREGNPRGLDPLLLGGDEEGTLGRVGAGVEVLEPGFEGAGNKELRSGSVGMLVAVV